MKIAILGGGIGGLCTAIALKLTGHDVEVYERHSTTSDLGAGIVCWPNASFILDKLGVLNKVMLVSSTLNYMKRFSRHGDLLGSIDINKLNELMGYSSYAIIRKDLMKILTDRLLELEVSIHYQHNVISLTDSDIKQVIVKFENGKTIQPDIIIGADGRMNSVTRKYVNNDNYPIYQGFINWIGVFESDEEIFNDNTVLDYWGTGDRFGIVPVSRNKAYWAGGTVAENIGVNTPHTYKQELNDIFDSWLDPIAKIINKTPVSCINKIYIHDHNPITKWHKKNVLLLGDAAHAALPTSGQGACQAIEDAWHFVNCLIESPDNISLAFNKFTQLRIAKTAGITMAGRQLATSIFNTDPKLCKERNLTSKATNYQSLVKSMAKGWASGLPLCTD
jgi:2-polyprenyl-6-methoxyphenol hydroxylase-like FAD-dependent oxidoreductase